MKNARLVTVLLCLLLVSKGRLESIHKTLFDYVNSQTEPDALPVSDVTKPLNVDFRMGVVDIEEVDYHKNRLVIRTWWALHWNSSITWNPNDFHGLKVINMPLGQVYVPAVVSYNTAGHFEMLNSPQVLFKNDGNTGVIFWTRWQLMCDLASNGDRCKVKTLAGGYPNSVVQLQDPATSRIDVNNKMRQHRFPASAYKVFQESYTHGQDSNPIRPNYSHDWVTYHFSFSKYRRGHHDHHHHHHGHSSPFPGTKVKGQVNSVGVKDQTEDGAWVRRKGDGRW